MIFFLTLLKILLGLSILAVLVLLAMLVTGIVIIINDSINNSTSKPLKIVKSIKYYIGNLIFISIWIAFAIMLIICAYTLGCNVSGLGM